jgi:FkbH-like protein
MSHVDALRTELSTPSVTLARTLAVVQELEMTSVNRCHAVRIGISANVSVDLLSIFLRKQAVLTGVFAEIRIGNHDDLLTDVERFVSDGVEYMVLLSFFDNVMPSFEQQIKFLSEDDIRAKEQDLLARWRLVFDKVRGMRQVFVCGFHRNSGSVDTGAHDEVDLVIERFNTLLRNEAATRLNVRVIDTSAIIYEFGADACLDKRFYLRNTAPYAKRFLDELSRRIVAATRGFNTWYYKALVLDCDNTLWGGTIGEDLLGGIQLDSHGYPGKVYWRAQHEFLSLERQGVLLCLNSKNNAADVDEALARHPFAVLRLENFIIRKVNWADKVSNLRAIAAELNIGLESIIFVDDSDFECEAVRTALPMVRVFQVPRVLPEFERVVREIRELFLSGGISLESRSKTAQYRLRLADAESNAQFSTQEEYLASLDLRVQVMRDDRISIPRISELTLKSNQFNLTSLRQSPAEIQQRMDTDLCTVYSLTVSDRFGSAGLTGVVLVCWDADVARLDAVLMSCRIIGRGVEFCFWPLILNDAKRRGCATIYAQYRSTAKNAQVEDFFERLGLVPYKNVDGTKEYLGSLDMLKPPATDWIKVIE